MSKKLWSKTFVQDVSRQRIKS